MQQLTGLDPGFLAMETSSTFGHVASLSKFDCGERPLTLDYLSDLVSSRLHLLPPLRRRLAEVPLGLSRPYWVEDPDFDLDFHVRELALPLPGDDRQLADQVARIVGRPLDRAKPLWELYLISGLADNRVGLLAKFHHAAVDGVGGRELMTTLLDNAPEPAEQQHGPKPPAQWRPDPAPTDAGLLARSLADRMTQPLRLLRIQSQMLDRWPARSRALAKASPRDVRGDAACPRGRRTAVRGRSGRAPHPVQPDDHTTPALGVRHPVPRRREKDQAGAGGHGQRRRPGPVRRRATPMAHRTRRVARVAAARHVPISIRTDDQGGFGNHVSAVVVPIGTDEPDPVSRLQAIHATMRTAKETNAAIGAELPQAMSEFAMPALAARAARVAASMRIADVVNPPFNLVISNVRGPRTPLYLAGAEMLAYYPVSAVADGQGLNITVQSYRDNLDFGLLACRELVPDVWTLLDHIKDAAGELGRAAVAARP